MKMPELLRYGLTLSFPYQFEAGNEFIYLRRITYVRNTI